MPVLVLADVVVALVAVLIILAALALAYLAGQLIPSLPLIGNALRNAVVGAFNSVASAVRPWASATAVPFAYLIQGIALSIWWALYWTDEVANRVVGEINAIPGQIQNAATAVINGYTQAVVNLQNDVDNLYNQSIWHADSLYDQAISYVNTEANVLQTNMNNLYNAAIWHANGLYTDAINYINAQVGPIVADINAVENTLEGNLSTAIANLTAAIKAAEAQAVSEINIAIAEADATAQQLANAASAALAGELNTVAADVINPSLDVLIPNLGVIGATLPAVITEALGLPGAIDLTEVTGVASALGLLGVGLAVVTDEVATCLTPNCGPLGGLSGLFNALEDAALWAALIALTAEAANNPAAAVSDLSGAFSGLVRGMATPIYDLIGLA